jgi:hypothetical protein
MCIIRVVILGQDTGKEEVGVALKFQVVQQVQFALRKEAVVAANRHRDPCDACACDQVAVTARPACVSAWNEQSSIQCDKLDLDFCKDLPRKCE